MKFTNNKYIWLSVSPASVNT